MYDCSGKEGIFIVVLECGYLSVCQRADVSGLPTADLTYAMDCLLNSITGMNVAFLLTVSPPYTQL